MIDPSALPWKLRESASPGWLILTTNAGDMIGRLRADIAEHVLRLPELLEKDSEHTLAGTDRGPAQAVPAEPHGGGPGP